MLEWRDFSDRPEASGKTGSYGRLRREVYTLDEFAAYSSALTETHRHWIERIAEAIADSHAHGAPFVLISIVGHAAYWDQDPRPTVPYVTQGLNRARAVAQHLTQRLMLRGLHNQVDIVALRSEGVAKPVASSQSRAGRALNRRVVVTVSELDPHHAPWRWCCKLMVDFGKPVRNPYDINEGGRQSVGTGVLISDRHVLTAAHNVLAVRMVGMRNDLVWVRPKSITVVPAMRGAAHTVQRPHGTWRGLPKQTAICPGFGDPLSFGDYHWRDYTPNPALNRHLRARDVAIVELKPKLGKPLGQRRLPGGKSFGWWGKELRHRLGFGAHGSMMRTMRTSPAEVRALGYADDHASFARGSARRYGPGIYSQDLPLQAGQSGSPYWLQFGSRRHLVAMHKGDDSVTRVVHGQRQPITVEWGVMLSPAKMRWIRSVIGR